MVIFRTLVLMSVLCITSISDIHRAIVLIGQILLHGPPRKNTILILEVDLPVSESFQNYVCYLPRAWILFMILRKDIFNLRKDKSGGAWVS